MPPQCWGSLCGIWTAPSPFPWRSSPGNRHSKSPAHLRCNEKKGGISPVKKNTAFTKAEKSWAMYDWANSVYATIIMAAVYPIYFTNVCYELGIPGDVWWSLGTSIATLVVAVCSPFFGALGDYKGMKKRMLGLFAAVGVVCTLFMAIFDNPRGMLVGYILSYIGFGIANLFYDSLLTDVATADRMDRVSSFGYSLGYLGGSTIPFILSILLIQFGSHIGIGGVAAVKISVVMTSVWWGAFSIPLFRNVKQKYYVEAKAGSRMVDAFQNLRHTLAEIFRNKSIFFFIIAYFFYIDGVGTVIHMATAYGSSLRLNSTSMILALFLTQIVAVPCAILFGNIATKKGAVPTLLGGIGIYIVVCILGFFMGHNVESASPETLDAAIQGSTRLFWVLSILVGMAQGGMQAISRSTFGKLIPPERSNEYFGFFDVFGKFATIMGPALYAAIATATGRSSIGILAIALLFVVGGVLLLVQRRYDTKAA
ncbi:MFS transporter [Ruminococcaceae bacterium OttesenSCG-928-L11]|nr:MFS transporter [Ruminococcaceae bacterium OttesenSCG-928-L11]